MSDYWEQRNRRSRAQHDALVATIDPTPLPDTHMPTKLQAIDAAYSNGVGRWYQADWPFERDLDKRTVTFKVGDEVTVLSLDLPTEELRAAAYDIGARQKALDDG